MLADLADEGPQRLTQERIDAYDREIHMLMPEITGLQALLAGFNPAAFTQLADLVDRVSIVDWKIGNASLKFTPGQPETAKPLGGAAGRNGRPVRIEGGRVNELKAIAYPPPRD